jgi:hypothetical protein
VNFVKKIIVILFVFISFWWSFYYISRDGEFTKWSHTTLALEHFEDGKPVYFGYNFSWKGIGKPTLEKIEFIKKDGTIATQDDVDFRIQPFITQSARVGALDEETILKEGIKDDLHGVKGFQVNGDFYLVLAVLLNGTNPDNDISTLRITYTKYGVTQFQNIPFDDGFIMDE